MVDLNADLGEGFGPWAMTDDEGLLDVVTSANVACGFHAGDASHMRRVCALAAERGVVIGAHVAYQDLAGFGRRFIDVEPGVLADQVLYQVGALRGIAEAEGAAVRYVKPHGALYHAIGSDPGQAEAVVSAVVASGVPVVLGAPGALWLELARAAGLRTVLEGFPDRGYAAEGTLVPRSRPGALVSDPQVIAERAVEMATTGTVVAEDGSTVHLAPGSLCVHGDSPGAVATARAVRAALEAAGVAPAAFASA